MTRRTTGKLPQSEQVPARSGPITDQGGKAFQPEVQPQHSWLAASLCLLLAVAAWIVFGQTLHHGFVNYDDQDFVTANLHIQGGLSWEGVKWAFSNTEQAAYWAPLMWLSHMLAWQLFGPNPWGHHLVNVLLHAANTVLAFLVFRRMTGATWRSLMVATLFGLHPLRVESVVWVTERKDVLSVCFGLLALLFYVRYVQKVASGESPHPASGSSSPSPVPSVHSAANHSILDYGLALFFFACGLMSKAMLVTWPFVMVLLDFWPLRRFQISSPIPIPSSPVPSVAENPGFWRLVFEKIPFFALAAAASVVTFLVQKRGGAVMAGETLPLGARGANALVSYCRYLGKMFWPTELAVFYPHPGHWPMEQVLLAGGVLLGISILFIAKRRRYPFLLVGWLWYCGTLVPVSGLVQSSLQAMADRFTYVPSLGVLVLATWGGYELASRRRCHAIALSVAGAAAIVLCVAVTRQQIGYWKDSVVLWTHTLACTSGNFLAHINLGGELARQGKLAEAVGHYEQALQLKPNYADGCIYLGVALARQGKLAEAIQHYERALQLRPDDAGAHYNLGIALIRQGKFSEAIEHYQRALQLNPDYAEAHNNLGIALLRQGKVTEAREQYERALQLNPEYAEADFNLGIALARQGKVAEAIEHYQRALQLNPDYVEAQNNLGSALARQGKGAEAIQHFERALQVNPGYAEARCNLGVALSGQGRAAEARQQFEQALKLATAQGNTALAESVRARLKDYEPALPQPQLP